MNISIDVAPEQLKFLEQQLQRGEYRSRSEVIRDILRRAAFEWAWKKGAEAAARTNLSPGVRRERKAAYAKLKGRFRDAL